MTYSVNVDESLQKMRKIIDEDFRFEADMHASAVFELLGGVKASDFGLARSVEVGEVSKLLDSYLQLFRGAKLEDHKHSKHLAEELNILKMSVLRLVGRHISWKRQHSPQ